MLGIDWQNILESQEIFRYLLLRLLPAIIVLLL